MPTIRLGTASPGTQATKAATLQQLATLARRAAAQHIDLLLLPEAYIGGYPRGSNFGCVIGDRTYDGREEFARYFEAAVDLGDVVGDGGAGGGDRWVKRQLSRNSDIDEEEVQQRGDGTREELERIAAESGVFLVVGLIERAGGTLYCSVVYVCPKEGTLGKRRKVMPTGTERLIWGQGSPATLRAVSTTIRGVRVNLAAAICWENYMPLLRQSLYAQNINLYLAPTADGREAWLSLMRTVAIEGRCFVVSSNMCERSSTQPAPVAPPTTAAATTNGTSSDDAVVNGVNPDTDTQATTSTAAPRRRNSMMTADGNEIALPHPRSPTRRRMSVFDSDGNEIVLSCPAEEGTAGNSSNVQQQQSQSQSRPLVNGNPMGTGSSPAATGNKTGWLTRGGSSIVSPFGDVLAGPQWEDSEGLIFADVDLRDCIKGRLDLDAAGSYSRNDSFKLSVNGLDLDPLPY